MDTTLRDEEPVAFEADEELRHKIFLLSAQLTKCQEDAATMKAAFTRRSALCRQEITSVVHEYVATGNAGNDHNKNQAIGRYVNFINAVTDGLTGADVEMRLEETARLYKKHNVGERQSVAGTSADISADPVGTSMADALTDPTTLGQTLDRIVELRNDRDETKHRLDTLHIRYRLLLEKFKGQEVAHARITKELEHRCETLGRHQLTLNQTIDGLEAKLAAMHKDNVMLRRSFAQQKRDANMEKELTNTQVAQLETQLRVELLRREAFVSGATGKAVVEFSCDISLDGDGGAIRNPNREMLERLVAESTLPIAYPPLSADEPFASATAAKALQCRISDMAIDLSVWRAAAITAQSERNKAEANTIALNEELSRIKEVANDRNVELPFDSSEARARATLHSLSDDRANFKEMTRTLRSELLEAAKRIAKLRRDLERLVVPAEMIKARDEAATAAKGTTAMQLEDPQPSLFKDLGSVGDETELLEALEGDIRQSIVDNIMWRKAAQRDLAIAHDQLLSERTLWVQQWRVLLDGLPPEVATSINTEGLAALGGDVAVATLVAIVEQSQRHMLAEAKAAAELAEDALKAGKQLAEGECQTEEDERLLSKDASKDPTSGRHSPDEAPPALVKLDAVTQTNRRWYTSNLDAQRIRGAGGSFAADSSDDDDGDTFSLTKMAGKSLKVDAATSPRALLTQDASSQHTIIEVAHMCVGTLDGEFGKTCSTQTQSPMSASAAVGTDWPSQGISSSVQCLLITDPIVPETADTDVQKDGPPVRSVATGSDFSFVALQKSEVYRHTAPIDQGAQTEAPKVIESSEADAQTDPVQFQGPRPPTPEEEPMYDYVEAEPIVMAEAVTQTDSVNFSDALPLETVAEAALPATIEVSAPRLPTPPPAHTPPPTFVDANVQTVVLGWDIIDEIGEANWFEEDLEQGTAMMDTVEACEGSPMQDEPIAEVPSNTLTSSPEIADAVFLTETKDISQRNIRARHASPQATPTGLIYHASQPAFNTFMFEATEGPKPMTRNVEVQAFIRKRRTHNDAACQPEEPLSLASVANANTSTASYGHWDRGTSPMPLMSMAPSIADGHSASSLFRSEGTNAKPLDGEASVLGAFPTPSLSPRSLNHSQSLRSPRSVQIRMGPYQAPPADYGQATTSRRESPRMVGAIEVADAEVGPGLFWKVASKCVGTDLDSRSLRDLSIVDAARSLMGVRLPLPSKQDQLAAMAEGPPLPVLYNTKGHYIGDPQWHPSNRKLPRIADSGQARLGPQSVSVSGAIRVLEPLDMYIGSSSSSSGLKRVPTAEGAKQTKLSLDVSPAPFMRKSALAPLSAEDEARAQMLARSQSPPCPMFHFSPSTPQRKGKM